MGVSDGPQLGQDESLAREVLEADGAATAALEPKMQAALAHRQAGEDAQAERLLREIVAADPRLAEPRLELAHLAATREDWVEAEAQAQLATDLLRAGGQWIADLPAPSLLAFALNLLGETMVRPLEEGDLFLVDRPAFVRAWNRAAACFEEACRLDPTSEDARRNRTRYSPLEG